MRKLFFFFEVNIPKLAGINVICGNFVANLRRKFNFNLEKFVIIMQTKKSFNR